MAVRSTLPGDHKWRAVVQPGQESEHPENRYQRRGALKSAGESARLRAPNAKDGDATNRYKGRYPGIELPPGPSRIPAKSGPHDEESYRGAQSRNPGDRDVRDPKRCWCLQRQALWIVARGGIRRNYSNSDEACPDQGSEHGIDSPSSCPCKDSPPWCDGREHDSTEHYHVEHLEPAAWPEAQRADRLVPGIEAIAEETLNDRQCKR